MTAIAYTNDLTTITDAQTTTGWSALGSGGAGLSADVDFAIQSVSGTFLGITKQVSNSIKGMMFDNGATITLGADDHIFTWIYGATPGILATLSNGGMRLSLGTSITDYVEYYVEGSDTYQLGGQRNFAVRYQNTAPSPGQLVGSPGTAPQWFGGELSTNATSKGVNLGIDVIRYGTGYYLTGGTGADPEGTFAGIAADNDTGDNQYGIFSAVAGGYEWKGRLVIGQTNVGTPAACEFLDNTGASITIPENVFTNSDFTQLIIDHSSTIVTVSGVTITALGTNDPGRLVFNSAGTQATLTGWRFVDFGITTLRLNATVPGCTWLRSGIITQNGATMDGVRIESCAETHAILSNNPDLIKNSTFIQGSGHAVRCDDSGPYSWEGNIDSGYTGTRGSNLNSSTGSTDAMFYNNSGGLITLNVDSTGLQPSVRNGAGATTVVNQVVTLTVAVVDEANVAIPYASVSIQDQSDDSEISAGTANNLGVYTDSNYNYVSDVAVNVVARKSSPGAARYVARTAPNTITTSGLNAGVGLAADPSAGLLPMVGVLRHGVQSEFVFDTSITATIDVPEGIATRKLIVAGMYWDADGNYTVSSATYDGNALTLIGSSTIAESPFWQGIFLYRYNIPASDKGLKDVVFTWSAAVNIKAIAFVILEDTDTGSDDDTVFHSLALSTLNPLAINLVNSSAGYVISFCMTDDLDSPTSLSTVDQRIRRSDLVRDGLLNQVTISIAELSAGSTEDYGMSYGSNSKTFVSGHTIFLRN